VGGRQPARARPAPPEPDTASGGVHAAEKLFALGTRRLADVIAPSGCEVRADHLQLDGQYARVLAVTGYPRLVTPGWLSVLVETDLPLEASLHVQPLASTDMVRTLGVQIARLQSARLAALRGERVADPEREIALEDAERLRERLQRGEERLFAVSLYLLVRAKSRRELDDLTRRVEEQLDALLAHSRRALWEQARGFHSCLPEGRDQLLVPRNLDTSALAATLPFVGPSLAMAHGMLLGLARTSQSQSCSTRSTGPSTMPTWWWSPRRAPARVSSASCSRCGNCWPAASASRSIPKTNTPDSPRWRVAR
jgi:hypothetical protein